MNHHNNSVSLASIVIDERFQTRAAIDQGVLEDYVDAILVAGRWPFPPIRIVSQFLVDGRYRVWAAERVAADPATAAELSKSLQSVPCERVTVDLTSDDVLDLALQHALAANHTHGLRRSNADKRRAVGLALARWPDRSDREIAKLTGTSHPFVGIVRGELELETLPPKLEVVIAPKDSGKVATLPLAKQQASGSDGKEIERVVRKSTCKEKPSAAKLFLLMRKQHFSGKTGLPQTIDAMAEANGGRGAQYNSANTALNTFLKATKAMSEGKL